MGLRSRQLLHRLPAVSGGCVHQIHQQVEYNVEVAIGDQVTGACLAHIIWLQHGRAAAAGCFVFATAAETTTVLQQAPMHRRRQRTFAHPSQLSDDQD